MTYIVQIGDTIKGIARRFQIPVEVLIKENNLENIIYLEPGIELIIPDDDEFKNNKAFEYYTVKKGDNLYQIGKLYNTSSDLLAEINGLELNEYIFPNQELLVPKNEINIYITKDGDTLKQLSDNLGVSSNDILLYNENIYLLPEQLIAYKNMD